MADGLPSNSSASWAGTQGQLAAQNENYFPGGARFAGDVYVQGTIFSGTNSAGAPAVIQPPMAKWLAQMNGGSALTGDSYTYNIVPPAAANLVWTNNPSSNNSGFSLVTAGTISITTTNPNPFAQATVVFGASSFTTWEVTVYIEDPRIAESVSGSGPTLTAPSAAALLWQLASPTGTPIGSQQLRRLGQGGTVSFIIQPTAGQQLMINYATSGTTDGQQAPVNSSLELKALG